MMMIVTEIVVVGVWCMWSEGLRRARGIFRGLGLPHATMRPLTYTQQIGYAYMGMRK